MLIATQFTKFELASGYDDLTHMTKICLELYLYALLSSIQPFFYLISHVLLLMLACAKHDDRSDLVHM
jgi:hypothetical protein